MENPAAKFLADAIRRHREHYAGGIVTDQRDAELYTALITSEVHDDHGGAADDLLAQIRAAVLPSA